MAAPHLRGGGSVAAGPAKQSAANVALLHLLLELGPAVEDRQDLVGAFRQQGDVGPHRAQIAKPLQLVGVLGGAADA